MCEHDYEYHENHHDHHDHHDHSGHHGHGNVIPRVGFALVLFVCGFWFKPLFIAAYLIAGGDILFKALRNLIKGQVFDENFLMGLATVGAICIKEFPEAVMVMVLYQIGEYFQHRVVEKSRHSITELMDIRPDYANLRGEKVSPKSVKIGDIITVKTGEKIPLDGVVEEGEASVDCSALTGESAPQRVKSGDSVLSGCINLDGVLQIKVTKEFGESTVSKILELVEHASAKKAKAENFITKFAKFYTPAVVALALVIGFLPPILMGAELNTWIERALTFLVISCPCALVISIPLSFFAGIGGASREGILVKGSSFIETLSKPSVVVFDKTGTLTKGVFRVTEVVSATFDNADLLMYAAYAESASSHPIAAAIRKEYGGEIPALSDVREFAGNGVEAVVNGKKVLAGNAKFVGTEPVNREGTVVYVAIDGEFAGYIVISDEIKEDSLCAVSNLKKMGIETEMLSGDTYQAATTVQRELGVDRVYAELLPEDKVNRVEETIKRVSGARGVWGAWGVGGSVIFVGDGINDAPVLTRADVGIAMGGLGADAAIEAADVVIMDDKPSKVVVAIKIAKRTMGIVRENIVFALGVKVLFLALGGAGLVTMWGAVFADVGVSLLATLNALRAIRRVRG